MTDNEIIRCLRHCNAGDCENCKALNVCDATFSFHKEALDLINRQKAENDSLKVDLAKCSIRLDNLYKTADEIKSEAIKECLAKVKNYIKTHCNPYGKPDFDYDTSIKILNFIDNILKEMTEVETNQRKEDEGK